MTGSGPMDEKEYLHRWLRMVRDVMLWKLEGLSDADIRRPMTRSGTNLLGLVKHLTGGEIVYLGETFGRPATDVRLPWWEPENVQKTMETGGDMYAAPDESTEYLVDLYRRACAHADKTIADLDLDDIGTVPHAGDNDIGGAPDAPNPKQLTLRQALVHEIHETSRHAGHADIVRELIDGSIGGARGNPFVPDPDHETWWQEYLARVKASATAAEQASNERP
ncbi:DinB family protein [Actinopolymorpha sp. B11F2]|uniref:DinB family protein n=1 Tax=Actinopolymorpha sp. B11F2 TaxID=3160862 RepID=UPI0032E469F1